MSLFNKILRTDFKDIDELHKYMKNHKTEVALAIFETDEDIKFPEYIWEAIKNEK